LGLFPLLREHCECGVGVGKRAGQNDELRALQILHIENLRDETSVVGDGNSGEDARLDVDIVVQLAHGEGFPD
jgi:hypothetical protein